MVDETLPETVPLVVADGMSTVVLVVELVVVEGSELPVVDGGRVLLVVAAGGVTDGAGAAGPFFWLLSGPQPASAAAASIAAIVMRVIFFLDYFSELKRVSAQVADVRMLAQARWGCLSRA